MLVILALVVLCGMSFAKIDKFNIIGGPHDLRYYGTYTTATGGAAMHTINPSWSAASYTLCNFCHIAHKFSDEATGAPGPLLWNHTATSGGYTTYSSPYMSATVEAITPTDIGNPSALCLSCHDGTVAVNSNYAEVTGSGVPQVTLPGSTGMVINPADISKQHPINFKYTAALATADGTLKPPASLTSVDAAGEIPLFNGGYMQCSTCHEPHQKSGILTRDFATAAGATRSGTTGWSWCLYCHSQSQT